MVRHRNNNQFYEEYAKYEEEQAIKFHEKELMESETRRLLVEQEKEKEKARLKTQAEHDAIIVAEYEEVQRKNVGVQRIGSIEKAEREQYQKYNRDLEYMTPAEIKNRNDLRLQDQNQQRSPYIWGASPKKRPLGNRGVLPR